MTPWSHQHFGKSPRILMSTGVRRRERECMIFPKYFLFPQNLRDVFISSSAVCAVTQRIKYCWYQEFLLLISNGPHRLTCTTHAPILTCIFFHFPFVGFQKLQIDLIRAGGQHPRGKWSARSNFKQCEATEGNIHCGPTFKSRIVYVVCDSPCCLSLMPVMLPLMDPRKLLF